MFDYQNTKKEDRDEWRLELVDDMGRQRWSMIRYKIIIWMIVFFIPIVLSKDSQGLKRKKNLAPCMQKKKIKTKTLVLKQWKIGIIETVKKEVK